MRCTRFGQRRIAYFIRRNFPLACILCVTGSLIIAFSALLRRATTISTLKISSYYKTVTSSVVDYGFNGTVDDALEQIAHLCAVDADHSSRVTISIPMRTWTRLRVLAAAVTASNDCGSTVWPVRESNIPFYKSDLLVAKARLRFGGYILTSGPSEWSDAVVAIVERTTACELFATASSAAFSSAREVAPTGTALRAALCISQRGAHSDAPLATYERRGELSISPHPAANDALVAMSRNCTVEPWMQQRGLRHRSDTSTSQGQSAVWGLLLDGVLPDGLPLPGAAGVPCDALLSRRQMTDALHRNYRASHNAPNLGNIADPEAVAAAVLTPRPPDPTSQNLPIVQHNTAAIAAAVATGDTARVRAQLMPAPLGNDLPAFLTSFNVMVSPLGVLQSLADIFADEASRGNLESRNSAKGDQNCSEFLRGLFEPEPQALADLKARGRAALEVDSVGGPHAFAALRARSPRVWFTPYWPDYDGDFAVPRSRTLAVYATATPENDEVEEPHSACHKWDRDRTAEPSIRIVQEVVVLTPPADSAYWVATLIVGQLAMLQPYLLANPRVLVHVPYYYAEKWTPSKPALTWLTLMGLQDRVVSGRIIARIVHVPDQVPVGPRAHPLHLLGFRDVALAAMQDVGSVPTPTEDVHRRVLLVQRAKGRPRHVIGLENVRSALEQRGVHTVTLDPPKPGAASLPQWLRNWTRVAAVVAPHGAALVNAMLLPAGAAVIETIPDGHVSVGLYYLHALHYARIRHTQLIAPGTLATAITHDTSSVVAAVCAAVNCTGLAEGSAATRPGTNVSHGAPNK